MLVYGAVAENIEVLEGKCDPLLLCAPQIPRTGLCHEGEKPASKRLSLMQRIIRN